MGDSQAAPVRCRSPGAVLRRRRASPQAAGFGTRALWNYTSQEALRRTPYFFSQQEGGRCDLGHPRARPRSRNANVEAWARAVSHSAGPGTSRGAPGAGAAMAAVFDLDLETEEGSEGEGEPEFSPAVSGPPCAARSRNRSHHPGDEIASATPTERSGIPSYRPRSFSDPLP